MKQPLLSIIIPCYNAEDSIGKLLESIIKQDFNDYEIIVINDGSKDNTKKEIEKYLNKTNKIIFIDKENTGVGDTRNVGIKKASGKYITFADSDDYYLDNFFDVIIPYIKKENFELLVFNANVMDCGKYVKNEISDKYKNGFFYENNSIIKYLNSSFSYRISNVPWNKIYVSKIIKDNNILFPNKKRGQDFVFNMSYTSKINKYYYINEKLYVYNKDINMLSTNKFFDNNINNLLEYFPLFKELCIDNNIDNYERYVGLFYLRKLPGIIINETNNPSKENGIVRIKNYLNNKDIKNVYKKIKIRDLDFKLLLTYIMVKLKLYTITYKYLYIIKNRNR